MGFTIDALEYLRVKDNPSEYKILCIRVVALSID